MATKCKGITTRLPVKICCVILIPVMAFIFCLGVLNLVLLQQDTGTYMEDELFFANLDNNDYFFNMKAESALQIISELFLYKSEENIRGMNCLKWYLDQRSSSSYQEYDESEIEGFELSDEDMYRLTSTLSGTTYGYVSTGELGGAYAKKKEQSAINDQIIEYRMALERFKKERGLYYYISDGRNTMTNLAEGEREEFIRFQPVYIIYKNGSIAEESLNENAPRTYRGNWNYLNLSERTTMYIAYSPEIVNWQNAMWRYTQKQFALQLAYIVLPMIVALILMLTLLAGTGRRSGEDGNRVFFTVLDKPWLDVGLILLCIFESGVIGLSIFAVARAWQYANVQGLVLLCTVPAIFGTLPIVCWLTSFAKRVKAGNWWCYTMGYVVLRGLWHGFKRFVNSLWAGASLTVRVILIGAGVFVCALGMIIIGLASESIGVVVLFSLIFAAAVVVLMLRYAKKLYLLTEGAKAASAGDYTTPIPVMGGELGRIADSINNISDGINAAVSEQLKSERFKTELITNVSHDIRTPLTSLITYTDLLKTEGLASEKAPEYLDILIQKSARLKTLTDDLFEATKAASGNVKVHLEHLDIADLMRQVLGELDERVKASGLEFRLGLPEHAYVMADGRLLWRVAENLLSNVFKYALKNSRVYVSVTRENGNWVLEIKNISQTELNVDPAELTERFKRGDDARSGEGSGLGLSIAQSFTQAQGGQFAIAIDGDLFKATVKLPTV